MKSVAFGQLLKVASRLSYFKIRHYIQLSSITLAIYYFINSKLHSAFYKSHVFSSCQLGGQAVLCWDCAIKLKLKITRIKIPILSESSFFINLFGHAVQYSHPCFSLVCHVLTEPHCCRCSFLRPFFSRAVNLKSH